MKKALIIAMACLLALSLVACGGGAGGAKADGVYTARVSDASANEVGHGYADELTLTYEGGKITDVEYKSIQLESGTDKATMSAEEYPMDPPPSEWMPKLAETVKNAASADEVDVITGATNSSNTIKELYKAIETEGKAGEVVEVTLTPAAE